MAKIQDTDHFILTRTDEANDQGGHKVHNQYFCTADQIGNYCVSYFAGGKFPDLEDGLHDLQDQMNQLMFDYNVIKSDLSLHESAIKSLKEICDDQDVAIVDLEKKVDDALSRSKVNVYYRLVNDENPKTGRDGHL